MEHQPHPGPSRSTIQAALDRAAEARRHTPEGEAERDAHNAATLAKLRQAEGSQPNGRTLTTAQAWLIAGALRLASQEYGTYARVADSRTGEAFRKQAADARALADAFEEAEAVIIR